MKFYVEVTGSAYTAGVTQVAYAVQIGSQPPAWGWGVLKDTQAAYAYAICRVVDEWLLENPKGIDDGNAKFEVVTNKPGFVKMLKHPNDRRAEPGKATKPLNEEEIWDRLSIFEQLFPVSVRPPKPNDPMEIEILKMVKKTSDQYASVAREKADLSQERFPQESSDPHQ